MRRKARDHIGLLIGKRLDTNLLRHRIRKYPDSPVHSLSDLLRIYLKISGFAVEFTGCVWLVAVSGKKKLQIQKYPYTCRRGVSIAIRDTLFPASVFVFTITAEIFAPSLANF